MEHKNPCLSPYSSFSTLLLLLLSLFFLLAGSSVSASASASTFISDGVFEDRASFGRNLLQAQKPCPVSFEKMNYTIITSQCKGPNYPAKQCCAAFSEFACPYAEYLNDLTNECATTMFSYINLNGNYPPGVFSSECKQSPRGLECNATSESDSATGSQITSTSPTLLVLPSAGFVALLLLCS